MKKEIDEFLKKSMNLKKVVHRRCSVLSTSLLNKGHKIKESVKEYLGYEKTHPSHTYIDGGIYYSIDEIEEERKEILAKIKENSGYLEKVAKLCQEKGDELLDISFKIRAQDLSSKSEQELIVLFKKFTKELMYFSSFLIFPHSVETYLSNIIDKDLLKLVKGDMDKYETYHKIIIAPVKHNFHFLEKESLLKIAVDFKDGKDISKKLKEHAEEYGSMGSKWGFGKRWSEEDFLSRIKDIDNPKKEFEDLSKKEEELKEQYDELLKELNINDELKKIIDITKEYVYLRTFRTDVFSITLENIHNLLEEIAKRRGLEFDDINNMTNDEILTNIEVPKEIIEERKKGYCFIENSVLIGKDLEYIKKHFQEIVEEVTEIKGVVASKGKVTGKVKIVMDNSQLAKVEKGDVLVSPMTTPDFVPAMERAVAFVTDEGGILCHAAIVSREMNKPCITGTKIATKVFKDGELVEVDAEKGIVKKLDKH